MKRITVVLVMVAGAACGLCWLSPTLAADKKTPQFTDTDPLVFGMELAQAQKQVADEKNWEIAYQIDTPSTNDIACRYKEAVMYLAQFYMGRCYSLEKRAFVKQDEAIKIFEYYTEKHGPTPEITNSRDQKLLFARWTLKDREIELTAYEHHTGDYMAIYCEFDPLVKGEAAYTRDNELQSQPTTIDPITGKPVPIPQEQASGDEGESSDNGDEASNTENESGDEQGDAGDDSGKQEEKPRDPPRHKDTQDDW